MKQANVVRSGESSSVRKRKSTRNTFQKIAAVPHSVWTVMFIAAPMLFVLYFAFIGDDGSFAFSNITQLSQYTNVFILSIAFALIATAVCLVIGYPLAYFMSRQSPRAQKVLMVLIMLPMWSFTTFQSIPRLIHPARSPSLGSPLPKFRLSLH